MAIFFTTDIQTRPSVPLTHPRIGWHNRITTTNMTATASISGYPATNILNPGTFERYRPSSSPAAITIDLGSAKAVDYMAVQTKNATNVKLERSSDGVAYTTILNEAVDDNTTMFLFNEITYRYWRITITGADLQVVAAKLGLVLAMPRPIYGGHSPMVLNRATAVRPNLSETGQFLGASQKRTGLRGSFDFQHMTADWYRANFDPFAATNPSIAPFFIAWRPETFPEDVNYSWATSGIKPSNSGVRDFMSASLSVEGFIDGI